jgi:rRNA maturation RNase YbeY
MKRHPLILIDFNATVKLSKSEVKKMNAWLNLAVPVLESLLEQAGFIHPSWSRLNRPFRISLLVCGEAKIKNLNSLYRKKNKVTDVLSFPAFNSLRVSAPKGESFGAEIFLGDLAICHQRTHQQSQYFDIGYLDEFIHLFFHGFIHLLGFDHELSPREEKIMERWEKKALDLFSNKKGP